MDSNQNSTYSLPAPQIERVRHELRRRSLTVAEVTDITPGMRRIVLTGDDLADFISLAPDDHVKVFVPALEGEARRDYTPRRYDNDARTLTIDFALHEAGPVTQWAIEASVGDTLAIGGPRGSAVVSSTVTRWLLIGDETALPAMGRRIEESDVGMVITAIAAVAGQAERQIFETKADLHMHWAERSPSDATDAGPLLSILRESIFGRKLSSGSQPRRRLPAQSAPILLRSGAIRCTGSRLPGTGSRARPIPRRSSTRFCSGGARVTQTPRSLLLRPLKGPFQREIRVRNVAASRIFASNARLESV